MKTQISLLFAISSLLSGTAHASIESVMQKYVSQIRSSAGTLVDSKTNTSFHTLSDVRDGTHGPAQPIRQANVRVKISKVTYQQEADGSYGATTTTVCSSTGKANVYDLRDHDAGFINNVKILSCQSTLAGKKIDVDISAAIVLTSGVMFDHQEEMKGSVAILSISQAPTTNPATDLKTLIGVSGTTDMNNHSLVTYLTPTEISASCSEPANGSPGSPICSADPNEFFTAAIDLQD